MTRGNASQSKVHYHGKEDDFVIFVDDAQSVANWKKDRSIPLAQVVSGFKIFVTHKYELWSLPALTHLSFVVNKAMTDELCLNAARHGAQNAHDGASKATLENEFGTHNEDECMTKILEGGTLQETESGERQGSKNDSMGTR